MKKDEFKETFSEIPGIYELPKNISDFFEQNKGVAEKFFWQANLLQTFEKICIFLAKVSLSEYKNSPFAKKSNQQQGNPAYKFEKGLHNSKIFTRTEKLSFGKYFQKFVSAIWLLPGKAIYIFIENPSRTFFASTP